MADYIKLDFPKTVEELSSTIHWDFHYIGMAKHVSKKSLDPGTKVGSVIVDKNFRTISTGYNGLPKGIVDDPAILNDRDRKLKQIIHGEENAIIFAKQDLYGMYVYLWPFLSCSSCASKVIQAGIKRVITVSSDVDRWKESFDISLKSFSAAGVTVIEYSRESYDNLEEIY